MLEIFPNERFGAIGQTGSGKSFVMLGIINGLRQENEDLDILIIDTKRSIRIPNFVVTSNMDVAFKSEHVIYRPKGTRPENSFYGRIWNKYSGNRKRDALLYIDEAAHITGPNSIPDSLELLVNAGREQGIGVWWGGQQSTNVNNDLVSQSEKMFIFRVPVASDRQKLIGRWGDSVDAARDLPPHTFIPYGFPEVEPIQSAEGVSGIGLKADTERIGGGSGKRR